MADDGRRGCGWCALGWQCHRGCRERCLGRARRFRPRFRFWGGDVPAGAIVTGEALLVGRDRRTVGDGGWHGLGQGCADDRGAIPRRAASPAPERCRYNLLVMRQLSPSVKRTPTARSADSHSASAARPAPGSCRQNHQTGSRASGAAHVITGSGRRQGKIQTPELVLRPTPPCRAVHAAASMPPAPGRALRVALSALAVGGRPVIDPLRLMAQPAGGGSSPRSPAGMCLPLGCAYLRAAPVGAPPSRGLFLRPLHVSHPWGPSARCSVFQMALWKRTGRGGAAAPTGVGVCC